MQQVRSFPLKFFLKKIIYAANNAFNAVKFILSKIVFYNIKSTVFNVFFGARCCYLQHLLFVAIFGAAFNILKPAICKVC